MPRALKKDDPRIQRAIKIVKQADGLDKQLRTLSLQSVRKKRPVAERRIFGGFRLKRFRMRYNKKVLKARKRLQEAKIGVR